MEYRIEVFAEVLLLKQQLVKESLDFMINQCRERKSYLRFLTTTKALLDLDSGFLLQTHVLLERLETILYSKRYEWKDQETNEWMNQIIPLLNEIKTYSDIKRNSILEHYLLYQEEIRMLCFEDQKAFLEALTFDATTYQALKTNLSQTIKEEDLFLSSTNYFIETIPEIYEDATVSEQTERKIRECENKKGLWNRALRKYAQATNLNFQKIKKKGE